MLNLFSTSTPNVQLEQTLEIFSKAAVKSSDFSISNIVTQVFNDIRQTLSSELITFKHIRDVHKLHYNLIQISEGSKRDSLVQDAWKNVLKAIDNKLIYNTGFGYSYLDCSQEIAITEGKPKPKINISPLDVANAEELDKALNSMVELDAESLGTYVSKGFYQTLLQSPKTFCLLAKTEDGKIGAWCWGTQLTIRNMSIFHIWGLARKADLCGLNLTQLFKAQMEDFIKDKYQSNYLTFAVEGDNKHAIQVYGKAGISIPQNNDSSKTDKIYVAFPLTQVASELTPPTRAEVGKAMKEFVVENMGYSNALYYEGIRNLTLQLKKIYYR